MSVYKLRIAKAEDLKFLFNVSTRAMLPVRKKLDPELKLDIDKEFKEYATRFVPEEIQVIHYDNMDVGRLRIVKSEYEIYVGGIQLLPEFQNKGIGSAIFRDLIREAEKSNIVIKLEVSKVNGKAIRFYKNLGLTSIGDKNTDWIMEYVPKKNEV